MLIMFQVIKLPKLTLEIWQSIATASVGLLALLMTVGFWPQRRRGCVGGLNLLRRIRVSRP
jgi:hypothetical protein